MHSGAVRRFKRDTGTREASEDMLINLLTVPPFDQPIITKLETEGRFFKNDLLANAECRKLPVVKKEHGENF
jgi:hypothetical protein